MPPTRPHLVSRVLARRFTNARSELTRFEVERRRVRDVGVMGFGRAWALYPGDPMRFEQTWKHVEDRLPAAFAAVDDGTIFSRLDLVELLKECLAIHLARGTTVSRVHAQAAKDLREWLVPTFAARLWIDDSFRQEHGFYPAGPEGRRMQAEKMLDDGLANLGTTSFTPDRMTALFDSVRPLVFSAELEIGIARQGEFLISDTPAVSQRAGHAGVGPLGGVPWDRASTITMPIGRAHTLALGRKAQFIDLGQQEVEQLNESQIRGAANAVAWHPDADLEAFVRATLDRLGR